jgi:hypothetical protein
MSEVEPRGGTRHVEIRCPVSRLPMGASILSLADALCLRVEPAIISGDRTRSTFRCRRFSDFVDCLRGRGPEEAELLLLPLRGLADRLLGCRLRLRLCLCFLRHAALLALSEWRYRTVPSRIDRTALRLLQHNEKNSDSAKRKVDGVKPSNAHARSAVVRRSVHRARVAAHATMSHEKNRCARNADGIEASDASDDPRSAFVMIARRRSSPLHARNRRRC